MSADHTYLSISKFVGLVLEHYPRCLYVDVLYEPKHQKPDRYKQFMVEPLGIILACDGKNLIMKYETIIDKFGSILIKFTETKTRKINFRSAVQILKISTEEKTFNSDGKDITYFPATIVDGKGPMITKLLELKQEYLARTDGNTILDDIEAIV